MPVSWSSSLNCCYFRFYRDYDLNCAAFVAATAFAIGAVIRNVLVATSADLHSTTAMSVISLMRQPIIAAVSIADASGVATTVDFRTLSLNLITLVDYWLCLPRFARSFAARFDRGDR